MHKEGELMSASSIAILGCGNIGSAIAKGLVKSGAATNNITLTRRKIEQLSTFQKEDQDEQNSTETNTSKEVLQEVEPVILQAPEE